MIGFYEVIDRAMSGQYCSESHFDMEIFVPKVEEVVSKYKIKYDPHTPIPSDDDLADRVFQAGLELYRDVGSYCPESERIMRFSEAELRDALAQAPPETVLGEGTDARTLRARKPESTAPPFCYVGAVGSPVEGPPRITFTITTGISAITARPRCSCIRENPGPEVAVRLFFPARDAPIQAPREAISSSIWIKSKPSLGISLDIYWAISEEGVMGYPAKKSHPAASAA